MAAVPPCAGACGSRVFTPPAVGGAVKTAWRGGGDTFPMETCRVRLPVTAAYRQRARRGARHPARCVLRAVLSAPCGVSKGLGACGSQWRGGAAAAHGSAHAGRPQLRCGRGRAVGGRQLKHLKTAQNKLHVPPAAPASLIVYAHFTMSAP